MSKRDILILRNYQVSALENIWKALQMEQSVLLEAACSSGKTLLFSKIIQRLLTENPSFRVLVLMDREVLVRQTQEKIIKVAPELVLDIGIICASVSDEKVLHKRITIASRQSLAGQLNRFEAVNLVVVDECHLMAIPKDNEPEPDQFALIINTLRQYNPKTRLWGVTATPFRLNDGWIFGQKNAPGCRPYFDDVHYRITVGELLSEGFLAPLVGKTVVSGGLNERLNTVRLTGGEFNLGELSDVMCQGVHIRSAVEAWKEHASDRKKTLVFAVTIEHAEKLTAAFNAEGISALAIHSDQDDLTSYANMEALKKGEAKVFCSVAKLTTGMDIPDIDCILMARATKSTALYKQILGRGQRIFTGKENCMVLDLVGNNHEHGTDLDNLRVKWRHKTDVKGMPVSKECPQCNASLHPAVRICTECGYEYPRTDFEAEKPELTDTAYGSSLPETYPVMSRYCTVHVSKKNNKELLRIRLEMGDDMSTVTGNLWMCFEDHYQGFAVEKGKKLWKKMTLGTEYPKSVNEAIERENEILTPDRATVNISGRWPEVLSVEYDEVPF